MHASENSVRFYASHRIRTKDEDTHHNPLSNVQIQRHLSRHLNQEGAFEFVR